MGVLQRLRARRGQPTQTAAPSQNPNDASVRLPEDTGAQPSGPREEISATPKPPLSAPDASSGEHPDQAPETLDPGAEPSADVVPQPEPPPVLVLTRTSIEGRSREHLRAVCAGLDAAGIDYWYVPSPNAPSRTRLATLVAAPAILAAVAPKLDAFWTASRWDDQVRDWVPLPIAELGTCQIPDDTDVLCFYATAKDPRGRRRIGISAATEVETWQLDGTDLVAPRSHVRGRRIPASDPRQELMLRSQHLRSYQALLAPEPTAMIDPIDAVITWVDSTDPQYLTRRRNWLESPDQGNVLAVGPARTRGLDELRYLLRSIDMYAPWLRHVYLVTDGQVPPWLDTSRDDITVVDHREIFDPDSADTTLPTFNSHAIEAHLHRVPGLSEHYLYFNDDSLLASRTTPETFFEGSGRILFQPSGEIIGAGPADADEAAPGWAGRNVRALLERDFGRTITRKLRHVPYPQRRSVATEVAARYSERWVATSGHRWRDNTDIAPIQLHLWYAMLTGRASVTKVEYRYVELSEITKGTQLTRMAATLKQTDMFCLNLRTEPKLAWDELEGATRTLLRSLYPFQSRFELENEIDSVAEVAESSEPTHATCRADPPRD